VPVLEQWRGQGDSASAPHRFGGKAVAAPSLAAGGAHGGPRSAADGGAQLLSSRGNVLGSAIFPFPPTAGPSSH